jgi:site-specific DNA-adenine methylase
VIGDAATVDPAAPARLIAPFPWFGGKARIASRVWEVLGDVGHFLEPFGGGLAVLLARPHRRTIGTFETVNDANGWLVNFWRAVRAAPDLVADLAISPLAEIDLHARMAYLMERTEAMRTRLREDPEAYDARLAAWWVWGQSTAIPGNWMASKGRRARPNVGPTQGIHCRDAGDLRALADRLRRVRILCGDWTRTLTTFDRLGVAGVLLDPPYAIAERAAGCYADDAPGLSAEACAWAIAHGDDPRYRIVLCGYADEHAMPATWRQIAWKAGGMDNLSVGGRGSANRLRERVWFSPHCLGARQPELFGRGDVDAAPDAG